ncbi:DNA excision repair protein ERCC-5 homolog [Syngnathus scovelli]|uniref:DNA excision repair protein ERCC-5 homolog n=1 Tax=Syngnathus scovelli TaxID=161590 RepID=UPI00210FE4AF|nr:DNA excision repair protein ERCC-5 homolog [Syngnathus scovelli]
MGVHGLWRLLESTGKPINPETLEGKILAVDISIWLNQAVKGVRDREGNNVQNAHLLTLFHRICKLLYFRIRPVFVFDGDAPLLKKQTLVLRRQRKEELRQESQKTNEKLLRTFLKRQAIKAVLGGDSKDPLPSLSSVKRNEVDDMYVLPALPQADEDKKSSSEEEEESEDEVDDIHQGEEFYDDPNSVDINSEQFACLPLEMKHELLKDMKEFSKRRRTLYHKPPELSTDFSQYQLSGLLHRNKLNQRLEGVEKEMNERSAGNAPQLSGQDRQSQDVESRRLVSEDNSHYILIKGSSQSKTPSASQPVSAPWSGNALAGFIKRAVDKPEPLWRPISEDQEKKQVPRPDDCEASSSKLHSPPSPRTLKAIQAAMSDSSDVEKQEESDGKVSPRTLIAIQRALEEDDKEDGAKHQTPSVSSVAKLQIDISSSEEETELIGDAKEKTDFKRIADDLFDSGAEEINEEETTQAESQSAAVPDESLKVNDEPDTKTQTDEEEESDEGKEDISPSGPAVNEWEDFNVDELESLESSLLVEQSNLKEQKQQQERMANTVTGQMYLESQELLRLFGIPFLVAPMEAEAQCAALDRADQTNGTITDDSDVWLFGGRHVYKNFFSQNKYVEHYQYSDLQNQLGLDRTKLINLAYLLGSDYTEGVPGVGYVTGMEILNEFPGPGLEPLTQFWTWWSEAQEKKRLTADPRDTKVKKKLRGLKLQAGFPNPAVAQAYLQPAVDESDSSFSWGRPQVDMIKDFCQSRFGWAGRKTTETLQPVIKQLNTQQTQLRIDTFFRMEQQEKQAVRSQRLRRAITCMKRKENGNDDAESDEEIVTPPKSKKGKTIEEGCKKTENSNRREWNESVGGGGGFLGSEGIAQTLTTSFNGVSSASQEERLPKASMTGTKHTKQSSSSSGEDSEDNSAKVAMVTAQSVFKGSTRARGQKSRRARGRGKKN